MNNRTPLRCAIVFADLTNFKKYNDEHGHVAGDKAICQVAHIFKTSVRMENQTGLHSHWGGDEFCALLTCVDAEAVEAIADRFRRKVETFDFGFPSSVEADVGTVSFEHERFESTAQAEEFAEGLVRTADKAMYLAKKSRSQDAGATILASMITSVAG